MWYNYTNRAIQAPARTYTAARGGKKPSLCSVSPHKNCFFFLLKDSTTGCGRDGLRAESLCGFKRLYCKGWLDLSSPSFFVPKRTGSVLTLYIDETISFPFSALIWIRVKNVRSCWNPRSGFLLLLLLLLVCLSFFFSLFFFFA